MTPEKILSKIIRDAYREYWGEEMMKSPFDDIRKFAAIDAMEEYAKQEVNKTIDNFVEWVSKNYVGYSKNNDLKQIAENYKNKQQ